MELRHLRTILAIAEEGSFTRAALRLHVAQSGLSQQAKAVEEELGVALFIREHSGIRLTSAGERAIGLARRVVGAMEEFKRLGSAPCGAPVHLRVAGTMQTLTDWLPDVVRRVAVVRPDVRVSLKEATSDHQTQLLRSGEIDAGIGYMPVDLAGLRLQHLPLCDEGMVALVRSDSVWARRPGLRLQHLVDEPLIVYPDGTALRRILNAELDRLGLDPQLALEANSPPIVSRAVREGLGVAVVSEGFPRHAPLAGLAAVPLRDRRLRRKIILMWPNRRPDPGSALQDFIDAVCSILAQRSASRGQHPQLARASG